MSIEWEKIADIKSFLSNLADTLLLAAILLVGAMSKRIKAWLESKSNKKFVSSINRSSEVRDRVAELRALYDADRVMLFQLHNGQYYFGGEGAEKCSMTHFVVSRGVSIPTDSGTKYQNIPTTHLAHTLKKLNSDKPILLKTEGDISDPFLSHLLLLDGNEWIIAGPIKDRKGHWRGLAILAWLNDPGDLDTETFVEYSKQIGDLIGVV